VSEPTPPQGEAPPTTTGPEKQSTPFLVLQFFVFPMAIVVVCVTVFLIFGLISQDTRTPREYLAEARAGGGVFNIRRWQAAHALANVLESPKDLAAARSDPKFVDEVLDLYRTSAKGEGDDVLLRRYLTLALGRLGDAKALPELRQAAGEENGDPQTVVYAIWALGALGDPQAVPDLIHLAGSSDAGVRKTALHSLAAFPGPEVTEALRRGLTDAVDDVRWNAALSLGRRGDASAVPVLTEMLDRKRLAAVPSLTPDQTEDAMIGAIRAAVTIDDATLRSALESLRDSDPDPRIREAARAALSPAKR